MTRTRTRAEIVAILAIGVIALAMAVVAATTLADLPSVARIWPIVCLAIDYLAGFVVVAAIRAGSSPIRPSSIQGLALPAVGYGMALSAATWGPGALGSLMGGGPFAVFAGAAASAAAAVVLARAAWDADVRIDPPTTADDHSSPAGANDT